MHLIRTILRPDAHVDVTRLARCPWRHEARRRCCGVGSGAPTRTAWKTMRPTTWSIMVCAASQYRCGHQRHRRPTGRIAISVVRSDHGTTSTSTRKPIIGSGAKRSVARRDGRGERRSCRRGWVASPSTNDVASHPNVVGSRQRALVTSGLASGTVRDTYSVSIGVVVIGPPDVGGRASVLGALRVPVNGASTPHHTSAPRDRQVRRTTGGSCPSTHWRPSCALDRGQRPVKVGFSRACMARIASALSCDLSACITSSISASRCATRSAGSSARTMSRLV